MFFEKTEVGIGVSEVCRERDDLLVFLLQERRVVFSGLALVFDE